MGYNLVWPVRIGKIPPKIDSAVFKNSSLVITKFKPLLVIGLEISGEACGWLVKLP